MDEYRRLIERPGIDQKCDIAHGDDPRPNHVFHIVRSGKQAPKRHYRLNPSTTRQISEELHSARCTHTHSPVITPGDRMDYSPSSGGRNVQTTVMNTASSTCARRRLQLSPDTRGPPRTRSTERPMASFGAQQAQPSSLWDVYELLPRCRGPTGIDAISRARAAEECTPALANT